MRVLESETTTTDERLLIEAAQRDPKRFAALYEANFDRVYAYIARRVGEREAAQDLTAEVFHQALAGIGSFEWRGAPFAAWLLGIAGHVLSAHWKRGGREVATDFGAGDVASNVSTEPGKDDGVERRAMLAQLVDRLPADQRLVIVRRFVEQRSLRDIAQELGRSEGAVKQLQLRALQSLRSKVKE